MTINPRPFLVLFAIAALVAACSALPIVGTQNTPTPDQPVATATLIATLLAVAEPVVQTSIISATTPIEEEVSLLPTATPIPAPTLAVPPTDEASERLTVPNGFAIRIFMADLNDPRLMDVGEDGNLYVAETGAGAVIRLPDGDGDGLADERQVVAEKLNSPHSVEWYDGSLIVAEGNQIIRLTDLNGDGDMLDSDEKVVVTTNIASGGGHSSRTAHVGADGKLYVATGSSSNNDPESDPRRATISRFNLDGTVPDDNPFASAADSKRQVVWAEGLRNSVDFVFLPDGRLWANHNGSDNLGDGVPPEEIVIQVEMGKHYGWPYCYTPTLGVTPAGSSEVHDTRVALAGPLGDCAEASAALFTDLAHQAPLGMTYYAHTLFPAAYRDNLFVAYHGSWNSSEARDCKVQRIVVRNGLPIEAQPFVTGFRNSASQDCASAWGRPAGVAVGQNGELFISDDQNGNVYRVVYVGGPEAL